MRNFSFKSLLDEEQAKRSAVAKGIAVSFPIYRKFGIGKPCQDSRKLSEVFTKELSGKLRWHGVLRAVGSVVSYEGWGKECWVLGFSDLGDKYKEMAVVQVWVI